MSGRWDPFVGNWLVSEHVYNPDGAFAGIIHHHRYMKPLQDGTIHVAQSYQPAPELANHPMSDFSGVFEFILVTKHRSRYYNGPDVRGSGLTWGDGILTGHGVWPWLGHNFKSLAVMANPQRQITVGKFYNASAMIANVIGIAVPDSASENWPEFTGPQWPADVARRWKGTLRRVSLRGDIVRSTTIQRIYRARNDWTDIANPPAASQLAFVSTAIESRLRILGSVRGVGQQSGWLLDINAVSDAGGVVELTEVLDNTSGTLISLRRQQLMDFSDYLDIIWLTPDTGGEESKSNGL